MRSRWTSAVGVLVLALVGCGDEGGLEFPAVVASGKYVEYGAWADVSEICMDDKLAAWDRYIEALAAYLGVPPPQEKIRSSWVPRARTRPTNWPCSEGAIGCAGLHSETEQAIVFVREIERLHEFVHAVESTARGQAHHVFAEGMAEYLSEGFGTEAALSDFAAEFTAMLDDDALSSQYYRRSKHFVGSLIERDGIEKYYEYRGRVARDGGLAEFADAYAEVYGEALADALAEMETTPVQGRWTPWGCDDASEAPAWTSPDRLEVRLRGECGDGGLFGGGLAEGEPGFSKFFTLDIVTAGFYDVTMQGEDGRPIAAAVHIESCPAMKYSINIVATERSTIMVWAGRHQVRVDYVSATQAASGVTLRLENLNPVGP